MTTVVVEDGSPVADSNSYVSVGDVDTIVEFWPHATAWNALDDDTKADVLVLAARFLEIRWRFYGKSLIAGQSMQWPRTRNYDDKGELILPGTIPQQLIDAQVDMAVYFAADPDALQQVAGGAGVPKSWSTDGLAITFDTSALDTNKTEKGAGVLLGDRIADVEFLLRSIGTFKDLDWLQNNKQTVVNTPL